MAAGSTFLLLLYALLGVTHGFYGDSISFMSPQKQEDGTFKVIFYHRQNGRKLCTDESAYACESGVCTSFKQQSVVTTDQDSTGEGKWCQSEGRTDATVSTTKTSFTLSESGCCWVSNVNEKKTWTANAKLDLGTRSDSNKLNSCPVTTAVSSLRVPQNCFSKIQLLAHDPDGDKVKCRFPTGDTVNPKLKLDETTCTLTSTGQLDVGVHVFEVMLDDSPTKDITLTYADGTSVERKASDTNATPLCSVKVQFSLEILASLPDCEAGHVQPMFLSKTPSHGDVLKASVGQDFKIVAEAQAHHASIYDFQVSGPQKMTKTFKDNEQGKAEVTLSWKPQERDLYRFVPVCFTAETTSSQSEMRCVVVKVTEAKTLEGKVHVKCSSNKMEVSLEKAAVPGIDEKYLKLNDQKCSLTSNSTHIKGSMSFSACGTKVEDEGDVIAFKNQLVSYMLPTEVITRRTEVKIDFSCQFAKTMSISTYFNLKKSDYIFTESSFGSFGYAFEIYTDSTFTTKVKASAYPVQVKLLDMIYMGIQAQSDLPNVKLFVESCKATPDDNPENALAYDLIKNGCLTDETVKTYPSDETSYKFQVQAFKFTGNYDQVYITCSVILCESGSSFSRCAQGCLKTPSRRRRALSTETVSHYITQGPLRFVREAVPLAAEGNANDALMKKSDIPQAAVISPDTKSSQEGKEGEEIKEALNTSISTVILACAFLVIVVLMAVVVGYITKKRRADDLKSPLVSGRDY